MNRKVTIEITYNTEDASKEGVFNALLDLDFVVELQEVKK